MSKPHPPSGPRLTPLVEGLPATVPFVGPETQERSRGSSFLARVGANESVFGPSPAAVQAMTRAAREVWKYPDPENHDLKHALADHLNIAADAVMVGEGIDGILGYTVRLFVDRGDAVVTSDGAYPTFNYHVAGFGGVLDKMPYDDDREDPSALVTRAAEIDAKLIYFANPDNPMGTWHDAATVQAAIDAVPDGCLLILDEAYAEFAPEGTMPPIDTSDRRVLRMRTFSKAYGMAGARVGYAIGHPDTIAAYNRIRNHFGICRISQGGALAALADQDWLSEVLHRVAISRDRIGEIGRANGLRPIPSATNFVTLDCGSDGDFARRVLAELVERGVFVRMPFVAPGNRAIRISCGTDEDLDIVEKHLPKALAAARG